MNTTEGEAWKRLTELDPLSIWSRCDVSYEKPSGNYLVDSFGCQISVSPLEQTFSVEDSIGNIVLNELGTYSRPAILQYLNRCKDIPLGDHLVNPSTLPGGDIFLRGTHVLPLERLANRFLDDIPRFYEVGAKLGGKRIDLADAALQIFPLPRIPVYILFWEGDEEFPAKASILFDTSCQFHLRVDIIWAVAMLSAEMMLRVI